MGQKIHPLGFRIGITQTHRSKWFSKTKHYPRLLLEDKLLRDYLWTKYPKHIVDIRIERLITTKTIKKQILIDQVKLILYTPVPGKLVDVKNPSKDIANLKAELETLCQKKRDQNQLPKIRISLEIKKIQNAYAEASVIADDLINQLEERVSFRFALKKCLKRTNVANLQGIKIQISGRLNGAEIARTEWVRKGRVPLHTLRADLDYSYKTAKTVYGILGIKVWTFKGEKT